jgi:hypothetical protein
LGRADRRGKDAKAATLKSWRSWRPWHSSDRKSLFLALRWSLSDHLFANTARRNSFDLIERFSPRSGKICRDWKTKPNFLVSLALGVARPAKEARGNRRMEKEDPLDRLLWSDQAREINRNVGFE